MSIDVSKIRWRDFHTDLCSEDCDYFRKVDNSDIIYCLNHADSETPRAVADPDIFGEKVMFRSFDCKYMTGHIRLKK